MTKIMNTDRVDIIIPVWNQHEVTMACLYGIIKNTGYPYRLILIDNGSEDETRQYLETLKKNSPCKIELIRNEKNLGFVKAVNQGLRSSKAPYVCVMNNDTIPAPGWLERLIEFSEANKEAGLMNPLCDGDPLVSIEDHGRNAGLHRGSYMEMNQCFLFATLIKKEVIEKIGYLDEGFGMGCCEDADYARRAGAAGYRCVRVDSAYVHHKHTVSFSALGGRDDLVSKNEQVLLKRWGRPVRVGVSFTVDKNVKDGEIEILLRTMLFLAREWCWISVWIFGDKHHNKKRLDLVSAKIKMPIHQNIRVNFLSNTLKSAQLIIRIGERLFGKKKRKRYDVILVNGKIPFILKMLCDLSDIELCHLDAEKNLIQHLGRLVAQKKFTSTSNTSNIS